MKKILLLAISVFLLVSCGDKDMFKMNTKLSGKTFEYRLDSNHMYRCDFSEEYNMCDFYVKLRSLSENYYCYYTFENNIVKLYLDMNDEPYEVFFFNGDDTLIMEGTGYELKLIDYYNEY